MDCTYRPSSVYNFKGTEQGIGQDIFQLQLRDFRGSFQAQGFKQMVLSDLRKVPSKTFAGQKRFMAF